ncbi:MAG: hypothetical protein V8S58_13215 [Lachnospiraceae bacterium]
MIIEKEVLKNTALYELEYAESQDAATWKRIPEGGEVSLTEILDKQPESATEITLYVRKAAAGSAAAGAATEIKIPARPAKPDPIQGTDVTKDSYSIKVNGQADSVTSTELPNLRMVSFSGSRRGRLHRRSRLTRIT